MLMFVNISPAIYNLGETLCSLNFASRCRNIELGQAKKQIVAGAGAGAGAVSTGSGVGTASSSSGEDSSAAAMRTPAATPIAGRRSSIGSNAGATISTVSKK